MGLGRDVIAALIFVNSIAILFFNPIRLSISHEVLIGLGLLATLGALIAVSGMIRMPLYLLLPTGVLSILDIRALGLLAFILFGSASAKSAEENMVDPRIRQITSAAFSAYIFFLLISAVPIYQQTELKIPEPISNLVIGRLAPLVIGCDTSYTGQECVDQMVSNTIADQCGDNSQCISQLNAGRAQLESEITQQFLSEFPSFSADKEVGEILEGAVNQQVKTLIGPYEWIFKATMAMATFSLFHFLAGPLAMISSVLAFFVLKVLKIAGVLEEKLVKVDKTIFSA